jgi:hypothetical protein
VSITAGGVTGITNANGRYELRSAQSSLMVTALVPPNGYEGRYSGDGTLSPGEHNFVARRIVKLTVNTFTVIAVTDGVTFHSLHPRVEFDGGAVELLAGTHEENVQPMSSNRAVVDARHHGGVPVIVGISPGSAVVTATYWSVSSVPMTVQVIPR